jgi:hypothetical protein
MFQNMAQYLSWVVSDVREDDPQGKRDFRVMLTYEENTMELIGHFQKILRGE